MTRAYSTLPSQFVKLTAPSNGSQYAGQRYRDLMTVHGLVRSMG
jgi:hypothetical protein